jgi:hypothetical protein
MPTMRMPQHNVRVYCCIEEVPRCPGPAATTPPQVDEITPEYLATHALDVPSYTIPRMYYSLPWQVAVT